LARRVSELYDLEVYTTDGKFIGTVDDLVFDDAEGKLAAIVVALDEKGRERRTIPYSAIRACADIILVSV